MVSIGGHAAELETARKPKRARRRPSETMKPVLAALVIALVVAVADCGGGNGASSSSASSGPAFRPCNQAAPFRLSVAGNLSCGFARAVLRHAALLAGKLQGFDCRVRPAHEGDDIAVSCTKGNRTIKKVFPFEHLGTSASPASS